MPHELLGTVNPREVCALKNGPPNGPFGFLVSAIRHGVIGTKPRPPTKLAVTVWEAFIVTVQVPVPVHPPPLQPVKELPAAGVAVSVTVFGLA